MRYTAITTALIALMASLGHVDAVNLCPGAPESLANTNRPYSGYKYADASWGIEKAFEAGYAANMVDCVDRCRQNHRCDSIGYQEDRHNCDMYHGFPLEIKNSSPGYFIGVATHGSCPGSYPDQEPCCDI